MNRRGRQVVREVLKPKPAWVVKRDRAIELAQSRSSDDAFMEIAKEGARRLAKMSPIEGEGDHLWLVMGHTDEDDFPVETGVHPVLLVFAGTRQRAQAIAKRKLKPPVRFSIKGHPGTFSIHEIK